MPIPNYTTKIPAEQSISELMKILVKNGAREVRFKYDPVGQPESIDFVLPVGESNMLFSIQANYAGMLRAMHQDRDIPNSYCNEDQAARTAWRIVKIWIAAQLAFVAANQASLPELLLHTAVTKDGLKLFQVIRNFEQHLLKG